MARLYFNCASDRKTLSDTVGLDLNDLREASSHAAWVVQVRDARGQQILTVPFASTVGKPN